MKFEINMLNVYFFKKIGNMKTLNVNLKNNSTTFKIHLKVNMENFMKLTYMNL